MTPLPYRPGGGADRRAEAQGRLLEATVRLLADGASFTELGVQRITDAAGMSRSAFYTAFPDKTALLLRLTQDFQDQSAKLVTAWHSDDVAGLAALVSLYERLMALFRRHAVVWAALREVAAYDPDVRETRAAHVERLATGARARLLRDQQAGLVPASMDVDAAVTMVVWGGGEAMSRHLDTCDAGRDAIFAGELARIVWYGAFRRPAE
ncbi:TetR/AcrR family transcriptional regulator [Couchioplanes caeruleus]|uniref:TetR/AcrR family transcriptional regulator n=1 Tax=Couchioplanes caeruleus TaxID=56438 RepID=UPI0014729C43|nr:TetR/AcrR family transcriptional regulator [Couchioplanes caeruleus]